MPRKPSSSSTPSSSTWMAPWSTPTPWWSDVDRVRRHDGARSRGCPLASRTGPQARDPAAISARPRDFDEWFERIASWEAGSFGQVSEIAGAIAAVRSLPPKRWAVVTSALRDAALKRIETVGFPDASRADRRGRRDARASRTPKASSRPRNGSRRGPRTMRRLRGLACRASGRAGRWAQCRWLSGRLSPRSHGA